MPVVTVPVVKLRLKELAFSAEDVREMGRTLPLTRILTRTLTLTLTRTLTP